MEPIQMKFAAFMGALSPEEQRAVVPLMSAFVGTMGAPGGAPQGGEAPPLPPPGTEAMMKPPPASAGAGSGPPAGPPAIPGGPPIPPPDPVAMSIGRQQY